MSTPNYGQALASIVKGVYNRDSTSLKRAAFSLENVIELKMIPKNFEYVTTLCAALAYDISNEPFDARRLYSKLLNQEPNDFSKIVGSEFHSKTLSDAIAYMGLRNYNQFEKKLHDIITHLKNRERFYLKIVEEEFLDDYTIFLSLMNLLQEFFVAVKNIDIDKNKQVLFVASKFFEDSFKFTPDSTIEILVLLYLELIRSVSERSIISLDVSNNMKRTLSSLNVVELWEPQLQAITQGLLKGNNIVYSSPPGTGKSFMAYVSVGKLEENKMAVYLVPTKSLSKQVYDDLSKTLGVDYKLAISDRDRTESDDELNDKNVIVATYEKMDALLRRKKIQEEKLQTIIIDEMQYLADPNRGLTLEFLLTKFRERDEKQSIQLVTLSGLLSSNDSYHLATWLNAQPLITTWKGIKTDEMIYYNGRLYHKEGRFSTSSPITPNERLGKYEQRKLICSYFAKNAIIKNEPVLISVKQRSNVSQLARELSNLIGAFNLLEMDLITKIQENRRKYNEVIKQIKLIEAELPSFAIELIQLLEIGVVYHHAGLPIQYKIIIENAIRDGKIDVVIATATLDAGVNFPFKSVILFNPKYYNGYKWEYLSTREYRNIAGRSGRPGYHRTGDVIVLASSENEYKIYKHRFWDSDVEPIRSSFNQLTRSKNMEALLQSQLLGLIISHENVTFEYVKNRMKSTWFWHQSKKEDKQLVYEKIIESLRSLEKNGFVKLDTELIVPTSIGISVNQSMFLPLTAFTLLRCLEYLSASKLTEEQKWNFLLILVGIPVEISNNDRIVKKVNIPDSINPLKEIFLSIDNSGLDQNRLEIALCYGAVLYHWINGVPTNKLLELCELDSNSETAFIEETLSKDAYWVLSTLDSITESMESISTEIKEMIKKLASYCKVGASNEFMHTLLNSGLPHVGRATAIKLNEFLKSRNINLANISEEEFLNIFPNNEETARILYKEIKGNFVF